MNQIKAGAVLSYVMIVLNNVVKLAYTPFLIRALGQSEFGLYSIAAATIGYLTIMDLGFGNAIIRYTAKYKALGDVKTQNSLHGMFIVIYAILGIIVFIAGLMLYWNVDTIFGKSLSSVELHKMGILILLLTFNLAITFPFNIYKSIIVANEKFVFSKILNILNIVITPIIMIPLLFYGYKSIALVIVMTIVNLGTIFANYYYCQKKIKINPDFKNFDIPLLKEISVYSFYVFLNGIVDQIYWNTGQFILGAVAGTTVVAVFAIAITIKNLYFNSSSSISGLLLPKVTNMIINNSSNKEVSDLFIRVGRLQFIILSFVLSLFVLFGRRFIILWAGFDYEEAYLICLVILIPVTIPLIQNLGITILQARNDQKFRSVSYVIIAILNLVISIPMAKMYGGLGCAITTGASLIIGNGVLMNWYYYKKIELDIVGFWFQIFKLSLPVLLTIILYLFLNYFSGLSSTSVYIYIIQILSFSGMLMVLFWMIGMNEYEKDILINIKRKFLFKK